MNFLVYSSDGRPSVRPDSSRCKDNGDYYVPDGIRELEYTAVVYARMCRSGKAIGAEFAQRYYDAVGMGILIYPDGETIYDKTSLLPMPLYNPITLEQENNIFRATKDGKQMFSFNTVGMKAAIEKAIVGCSLNTTIRKGDFVIAELAPAQHLCSLDDGGCRLNATFCNNETIDMEVKF